MYTDTETNAPPFSDDLSSLVWPMSAKEFVSTAMQTDVLFRCAHPSRLALLEDHLGSFDLRYLLAHGDETTIWKQGGREVTRGTDSDRDAEALVPGITIQTHLMTKMAFAKSFVSTLARQMHLESGFFSIFASKHSHTATHYDRNYNFTIQLLGEKTWTVDTERPAIDSPSESAAFQGDRLALMSPQMHGAICHEPDDRQSIYRMTPGNMLYVPPGYWHATECTGLSVSLNLSIEPRAWFQVLSAALIRHLSAQREWRAPFGVPTPAEANEYLRKMRQIVNFLSAEDVGVSKHESQTVSLDEPLRRTLGSLLMWEKNGAGIHFGVDELRFLVKGIRGRWIEILPSDMESALVVLSKTDDPKTVRELSVEAQLDSERMRDFVQRLVDLGYLTTAT